MRDPGTFDVNRVCCAGVPVRTTSSLPREIGLPSLARPLACARARADLARTSGAGVKARRRYAFRWPAPPELAPPELTLRRRAR